jgi:hypothetical protein
VALVVPHVCFAGCGAKQFTHSLPSGVFREVVE